MPQGTWFGPYVFFNLIDDFNTMNTFKFVNDVILTELIDQSNVSGLQLSADQITDFSNRNFTNFNTNKAKEMLSGAPYFARRLGLVSPQGLRGPTHMK